MPAKDVRYTHCLLHGRVEGDECVQCRTTQYINDLLLGKVDPPDLQPGDGPDEGDPSPVTLALRALSERNMRLELDEVEINDYYEDENRNTPAEDVIAYIKEAMPDYVSFRFWMELKTCIDKQLGINTLLNTIPLKSDQQAEFLEEKIPTGKYADRKIKDVLKRDRDYLIKLCHRPSFFQMKLRRLLWGMSEPK